ESCSVQLRQAQTRYALYPVWILNTKWKDQLYTFAMNGQTGKFVGDLPLDKGAYIGWLLGLLIGIAAVTFAVYRPEDMLMRAGIALGLGLLVSLITTGIMKGNLKSVHSKHEANDYVKAGSLQITFANDTFTHSHLDKTEKQQDKD
ncbi:MAG: hypothetical protein J6L88_08970, partial [Clostridia bacterium]|nr:hypothetical protein [Clostridia bacterium]